jgi:hypothetical protein
MNATMNDAKTNNVITDECYNEQFESIKSGYNNKNRCWRDLLQG